MDLASLRAKLAIWFDPDHDWRSVDKLQHLLGGFGVCLALQPFTSSGFSALCWTLVIGLVYECGQADTAHSLHMLGKPGHGIGLLDWFYDGVGALLLLWLRWKLGA